MVRIGRKRSIQPYVRQMLGKAAQPQVFAGARLMIVKLVRPNDVGAPCLLFGERGLAGVLKGTPEVLAQLKGRSGFF